MYIILCSHQNVNCRVHSICQLTISWCPPPQISQGIRRQSIDFLAPHLKFTCRTPPAFLVLPVLVPFSGWFLHCLQTLCVFTISLPQIAVQFSSVQSLSCVRLFANPWIGARQASLSITNSRSSLRLVHQVSDAIQPSHPLSSPSPAPNPSQHQSLFQRVSSSHEVAKVLEFQL